MTARMHHPLHLIQSNMGRDSLSGECLEVRCRCDSTRRVGVVGSQHLCFLGMGTRMLCVWGASGCDVTGRLVVRLTVCLLGRQWVWK